MLFRSDVDAFAAALIRMIEDDELRHRCGPAALETGKGFKMDAIGPMWDELFRELLDGSAPAGQGQAETAEVSSSVR